MFDKTESGNKMELFFERSLERFRSISYHSLQSPTDVSRISFFFDVGISLEDGCVPPAEEEKCVESSRSSGGVWPPAIRSVTSLATEK